MTAPRRPPEPGPSAPADARRDRLARALRENLRKRRRQAEARRGGPQADEITGDLSAESTAETGASAPRADGPGDGEGR